ncbi:uncharacterized protein N7498_007083 [Penicillium cinerascens]|uniref:Secreted protein n=1 Tax=Penicillium cinerascens TaxID=70096 RepID=A0A9W9MCE5_9EURO|nr:uncharacterized protein N7498_007083 [Penicillium cinerascens]KAJ5197966.1 secreted protein [Penicillium cinerascens]
MKSTLVVSLLAVAASAADVVNQTTCAGTTYKYTGLAGYGFVPSNATDKYGDTIGGIGSSVAIDSCSWRSRHGAYHGTVYTLPDRGWNTNGTLNYQNRIHKFAISLKLAPHASVKNPSDPNIRLEYLDTILLTGPCGEPTTGLDADFTGYGSYDGFPPLPVATYTGNGFGGPGKGGRRISIDPEGLALDPRDGGFWVSDEYGPYIYKFSSKGRMELAIQPPQAYLPRRNGTLSFNSNSPPLYDPEEVPIPENTVTGRANNQGLEGLTISPDGKTLYALMQSALDQEGGPAKQTKQPARMIAYDISGKKPKYIHEWVVMLPKYFDYTSSKAILARDSGFGHGKDESLSMYRQADVFSVLKKRVNATDLKGLKNYDTATGAIPSSEGVLNSDITPAEYCPFLDFNVNSELGKFRLHNGGAQDQWLLNEKWESLALVPAGGRGEYFLISFSDNDFITQDGHMNFGKFPYKDESGYNVDNQVLAFKVKF